MPATLPRTLFFYLAIGLGQGLLLWWAQIPGLFEQSLASLAWALVVLALVGGLGLQLLAGQARVRGALVLLAGLAVLMALITGGLWWQTRPQEAHGSSGATLLRLSWGLVNCGVTKLVRGGDGIRLSTLNGHAHFEGPHAALITYR